ncbi:MAG TPA: TadE/TadG family type IV pilus assembly protein [Candidatus Limnocylindrales bacterium]|nr:TadE/TadG family type IV pilus assembly protein [Candidatus Limnocylindrales bacterium]
MARPNLDRQLDDRQRDDRAPRSRRGRSRGQSLVEFSIVFPVLLAITGVVIDASRVYLAWSSLESATRDAAQYLATSSTDPYSPDYTWAGTDADAKADYILELTTGEIFATSPSSGVLTDCTNTAQVTTVYSTNTSFANGGSAANPLSTARVKSCFPFRTLFAYPFLTTNGAWVLQSERQITILVGR